MDTSNSDLRYVLDGLTIDGNQFTSADWLQIVRKIFGTVKPYRDYLRFVRDHSRAVEEICSHVRIRLSACPPSIKKTYTRRTPPLALGEETRLLPLIPLYGWDPDEQPRWQTETNEGLTRHVLYDQYLLFGLGWVKLERRLEHSFLGRGLGGRVTKQYAAELNFSELDEDALLNVVGERPERWMMLCESLLRHLETVIEQKQEHIRKLQAAFNAAFAIKSRIRMD